MGESKALTEPITDVIAERRERFGTGTSGEGGGDRCESEAEMGNDWSNCY